MGCKKLLDLPEKRPPWSGCCHGNKHCICSGFHMHLYFFVKLVLFLKCTYYASPNASFNTIITPSRGSLHEGPSVTANRAATLAALSLCLQAIWRCVSAPLNTSRGKSIKPGVREENPIKRCAWSPQPECSPPGFIRQSERHRGGLHAFYINCITGFYLHNVYQHIHYLRWILKAIKALSTIS